MPDINYDNTFDDVPLIDTGANSGIFMGNFGGAEDVQSSITSDPWTQAITNSDIFMGNFGGAEDVQSSITSDNGAPAGSNQTFIQSLKSILWNDKKGDITKAGELAGASVATLFGGILKEALTHEKEKTLANQTKTADAQALNAQTTAGIATRQSNFSGGNVGSLKPAVIGQVQRPAMPVGLISQPRTA